MLARTQRGAGTLFFLFFLFLFSIFLYIAWIVFPIYLENTAVKQALKAMSSKNVIKQGQTLSVNKQNVLIYLGKMFRINNVKHATFDHVTVQRQGRLYTVEVVYQVQQHLFYNADLLLSFDDIVTVEAQ